MFDATLQRRVYKTIANNDVILCSQRNLPSSIGLSSGQSTFRRSQYFISVIAILDKWIPNIRFTVHKT